MSIYLSSLLRVLFCSVLSSLNKRTGAPYSGQSRDSFFLDVIHIKCPPPESLWRDPRQRQSGGADQLVAHQPDDFAKWEWHGSGVTGGVGGIARTEASALVYEAYCCQGVLVMAQAIEARDRLVFVWPDLVTRSKRRWEAHQVRGGGEGRGGGSMRVSLPNGCARVFCLVLFCFLPPLERMEGRLATRVDCVDCGCGVAFSPRGTGGTASVLVSVFRLGEDGDCSSLS